MSKANPIASDWREGTLARMRALILDADPEMIEERKWRKPSNGMTGVPVWSHNGIVCTGGLGLRLHADVNIDYEEWAPCAGLNGVVLA